MFGSTENSRTKTEDIQKNESCYGGFGGRFSYERCRRDESGRRFTAASIASVLCACIMVGAFGALCGIVMYHIVETNKQLYFPSGDMAGYEIGSKEKAADKTRSDYVVLSTDAEYSMFETVTNEVATRYRVPTGVMLKRVEEDSEAYEVGFRAGDIIVDIDGTAVNDIDNMNAILASREAVTVSKVTVFRDNVYVILDIVF